MRNTKNTYGKYYNRSMMVLLLIATAIVPLIVQLKIFPINTEEINYWNSSINSDFFHIIKA